MVVRWNTPSGKDVRPVARSGTGWVIGAMKKPRPLYRLPELADAQRVYVVEGEKCADALAQLGVVTTTSAGGCNAARLADWAPLAGRDIVIFPDNDDAGRKYARDILGCLARLQPRSTVRVVELPGLPDGGDVFDFIEWRDSRTSEEIRAEIESLIAAAPVVDLADEVPRPTVPTWRPFPVDALPEPVRSFVVDGARALGCDPSYIALPLLAALAAAMGTRREFGLVGRGQNRRFCGRRLSASPVL